jgi:multidrug resistance efflux pump
MLRKWPLAVGLATLVLVGAIGWGWWWQHRTIPEKHPQKTAIPAAPPAPAELSLQGKIEARKIVSVPAPVDGFLDQYLVNAGEEVFEGEVLARIKNTGLDTSQQNARVDAERAQTKVSALEAELIAARLELSRARSDVVRAKSQYEQTQKLYQRQKTLLDVGATPRLTFEKAEQDYQNAKSDYNGFQGAEHNAEDRVTGLAQEIQNAKSTVQQKSKDLDNVEAQIAGGEVRSQVSGLVVARRGQPGDPVDQSMKDLLQIAVDLSSLQVVADADPHALEGIHPGQAALVEIAESPSMIEGTVREIKGGQVFVDFISPASVIRPGLTARVKITKSQAVH